MCYRIDINIDLNNRPQCPDSSKFLDRLEQIEKETRERFKEGHKHEENNMPTLPNSVYGNSSATSDFDLWNQSNSYETHSLTLDTDINSFYNEVSEMHSLGRERIRFLGNNDSEAE